MEDLLLGLVRDAGVQGVLLFIIVAGFKQWWVWGWLYQEKHKEAEEWKQIALRGTSLAEEAMRKQNVDGK